MNFRINLSKKKEEENINVTDIEKLIRLVSKEWTDKAKRINVYRLIIKKARKASTSPKAWLSENCYDVRTVEQFFLTTGWSSRFLFSIAFAFYFKGITTQTKNGKEEFIYRKEIEEMVNLFLEQVSWIKENIANGRKERRRKGMEIKSARKELSEFILEIKKVNAFLEPYEEVITQWHKRIEEKKNLSASSVEANPKENIGETTGKLKKIWKEATAARGKIYVYLGGVIFFISLIIGLRFYLENNLLKDEVKEYYVLRYSIESTDKGREYIEVIDNIMQARGVDEVYKMVKKRHLNSEQ